MDTKGFGINLAYAALDEVPTARADAKEIIGLVKSEGKVTGYQLSDGETVSKEKGVAMAKAGEIQGVGIAHRKGSELNLKATKNLHNERENRFSSDFPFLLYFFCKNSGIFKVFSSTLLLISAGF